MGLSSSVTMGMRAEKQLRSSEVASPCLVGCRRKQKSVFPSRYCHTVPSISSQGSLCAVSLQLQHSAPSFPPPAHLLSSRIPPQKHCSLRSPQHRSACAPISPSTPPPPGSDRVLCPTAKLYPISLSQLKPHSHLLEMRPDPHHLMLGGHYVSKQANIFLFQNFTGRCYKLKMCPLGEPAVRMAVLPVLRRKIRRSPVFSPFSNPVFPSCLSP